MAAKRMGRKEQVVRAAKLRACVVALLKNSVGMVPSSWIRAAPAIVEFGFTSDQLSGHLNKMITSGLIVKEKATMNSPALYHLPGGGVTSAKEGGKEVAVRRVSNSKSAFQIDVVQRTGRVRLSIGGMVIEIGVVN